MKQKRLAKTAPVPCIVRDRAASGRGGLASPRTCSARRCIRSTSSAPSWRCARRASPRRTSPRRFFVSLAVVRQRLRLASVSPKLLEVYAEDGMTLEQLMAFTVNPRPRPAGAGLGGAAAVHNKEPYQIRRMLTEGAVRASDRRARFVGIDAYEAAGGVVLRDLFEDDDGGWLQDPALLDRLVAEKLEREAESRQRRRLEVDRGRARFPVRPHATVSAGSAARRCR